MFPSLSARDFWLPHELWIPRDVKPTSLTIGLKQHAQMIDMSSLTSVRSLRVLLLSESNKGVRNTSLICLTPDHHLLPLAEEVIWDVEPEVWVWKATARARATLQAFEEGCTPNLKSVRVGVALLHPVSLQQWASASLLLRPFARKYSLDFCLDVRLVINETVSQLLIDGFAVMEWDRHFRRLNGRALWWKRRLSGFFDVFLSVLKVVDVCLSLVLFAILCLCSEIFLCLEKLIEKIRGA
ncbi:hypothetical protein BKA62DRAFT_783261 [Auriculariales sp. MPI-PUGE-AT-0066]|nr:hypothetical protein BKA62DRAFT_783261 [Auriculariales sp. MPI-PUGE-AT-0066]